MCMVCSRGQEVGLSEWDWGWGVGISSMLGVGSGSGGSYTLWSLGLRVQGLGGRVSM